MGLMSQFQHPAKVQEQERRDAWVGREWTLIFDECLLIANYEPAREGHGHKKPV